MNQSKQKYELREFFLKSFVSELIKNSFKEEPIKEILIANQEQKTLPFQQIQQNKQPLTNQQKQNLPPKQLSRPKKFIPQVVRKPGISIKRVPLATLPPMTISQLPAVPGTPPPQVPQQKQQKPEQTQEQLNIGRISPILKDPAVFSVECPGPQKQILVNRSGAIQTSNINLSKEEIDAIMKTISEKTKIPLMQGLFKAAYNDLIVTAVISDFIGTRFLIQKRTPF